MSVQDDINKEIDNLASDIMGSTQGHADDISDDLYGIRTRIMDLLAEYEMKDGKISKSRLRSLLRELDEIEVEISDEFYTNIDKAITEVSKDAEKNLNSVLIATLGIAIIYGVSKNRPDSGKLIESIRNEVFNEEINGMSLGDRIASSSRYLRDALQQAISYGIYNGETVGVIYRRVRSTLSENLWRFKRIITTELPIAFRRTIAKIGGNVGVIKAVKIIDNRGRHRYHESHECYRLAEQDKYGMGKGIYLPTDSFILDPHPQCTAYYHYIFDTDELEKARSESDA